MKYIKTYENSLQYREVDLQQIWDDINKYHSRLFDKPMHTDMYFHNQVLKPLLLDKEVEFNRFSDFGGEPYYDRKGKVEKIDFNDYTMTKEIAVKLHSKNKFPTKRKRAEITLARIINNMFSKKEKEPQMVKIYNSEPLEIENKIQLLKDTDKYNL
jgi:hypothetical protein